jgi:hypothetical protein
MVDFNPATMNPASIILPSNIEKFNNTDYFEYFIIIILIIIIAFMIIKRKN